MITERAMLAAVHISVWTAIKHDRKVSREVAQQHGAHPGAGRYNKQLLREAEKLESLRSLSGQIRQYFYKITLPWSDEGYRLLPAHFYFELATKMREFEQAFAQQVEEFLAVYPSYIEQVRPELNGLFREEDYPSADKLRNKFEVRLEVLPIPSGEDFRVTLSQEEQARVAREIDENVRQSLQRGTEDLWVRLKGVVSHMVERLKEPELFRLGGRPSRSIATMATDGVSLFYNPAFVDTLNAAELAGVLAHEVMHPALQHHTRRGDRSLVRWNMACDYAVNPILLDAGLTLPKDVLIDNRFRGMSAERIYNMIEEDDSQDGSSGESESQTGNGPGAPEDGSFQNDGSGNEPQAPSTPGGVGQVLDASEPEAESGPSLAEQAREWQIAVEQAETVAKVAGKLPGGAVRALEASHAAKVDWRELLRRAWSDTIPSDYSWTRPNRRHVWSGLYLPGITSEGVGEIAIAVDCSGSVNARQLGLFEAEIRSILAGQQPRLVHVLYFDAAVQKVETYQAGQPVSLFPVGGGGTDFRPCFDWIQEHGVFPQTLVFLTDLCGTFPREGPTYPVIWASTEARRVPFGEVVPMEAV